MRDICRTLQQQAIPDVSALELQPLTSGSLHLLLLLLLLRASALPLHLTPLPLQHAGATTTGICRS